MSSPSASGRDRYDAVSRAIEDQRAGRPVLVLDDDDREDEADLIVPAATLSESVMALMIRHGSGIVCLCMTSARLESLELPPMVVENTNRQGTAFTVSIEAARGITTGVSAADRVRTVEVAIDPHSGPDDLARPGHVFPLRAVAGGVLGRRGHTEAAVDLARLAGLPPAGVLCELMNDDGTMSRGPQVRDFARDHGLRVVSVDDLVAYRLEHPIPDVVQGRAEESPGSRAAPPTSLDNGYASADLVRGSDLACR